MKTHCDQNIFQIYSILGSFSQLGDQMWVCSPIVLDILFGETLDKILFLHPMNKWKCHQCFLQTAIFQKKSLLVLPRVPENPNFENETRQTRTRTFVKMSNPTKPEPEVQTRGYPMGSKWLKKLPKPTNFQSNIATHERTFWYYFILHYKNQFQTKLFRLKLTSFCKI